MFSVLNFSISRLNNAEACAFFLNLKKAITNAEAASLGVDPLMPAFDAALNKLVDRVYVSSGSEYTAAMKTADDRRIAVFRRIRLRLQMVEVAEQNEALNACKDVVKTHLLSRYVSSVAQMPYQERSAVLQGFIMDLRSKLDSDAISALGISSDIAALESANNEFIELYNSRAGERAEGEMGLTAKLRGELNDIYAQVCFMVQYLANSTDETNAEKAAACQSFIAVINVILADAKKRLNQRLSGEPVTDDTEGNTSGTEGEGGSDNGESGTEGSGSDNTSGTGNAGESGSGTSTSEGTSGSGSGTSGTGSTTETGSGSGSTTDSGSTGSGSTGSTDTNAPSETGVDDGREISY